MNRQTMRRIVPGEKQFSRKGNQQIPAQSFAVYDPEESFANRCRICYKHGSKLVNPCTCNIQYHQSCILKYIKGRLISMGKKVDFSQVRCRQCSDQIRFLFHHNNQYSCAYFRSKMRKNWCSKTLTIILCLLLGIIVIAIIISQTMQAQTTAYLMMLVIQVVLSVIELSLIIVFVHHNLMFREIVLVKVYDYHEVMGPTHTSSEDDNPISHQNIEIIINENY